MVLPCIPIRSHKIKMLIVIAKRYKKQFIAYTCCINEKKKLIEYRKKIEVKLINKSDKMFAINDETQQT